MDAQEPTSYSLCITDNAQWEAVSNGSSGGLSLNMSAGKTIFSWYICRRNLKVPVLVYCGGSMLPSWFNVQHECLSIIHSAACITHGKCQ